VTATRTGEVTAHRGRLVAAAELLVTLAALYGGVGLIADNAIGMGDDWLAGTPFTSWMWPGILLLLVVAAPMAVAAVLELGGSRWATTASVLAGAAQIGWIGAQLLVMQRYHVLQPIMLGFGLLVVLMALWTHRRTPLGPERLPSP
jgi:hypothetical protein